MSMTEYDHLIGQRSELEARHAATSDALKQFPRLANGLTPDNVRNSSGYIAAKLDYDVAFQRLRQFNQRYAKVLRRAAQ